MFPSEAVSYLINAIKGGPHDMWQIISAIGDIAKWAADTLNPHTPTQASQAELDQLQDLHDHAKANPTALGPWTKVLVQVLAQILGGLIKP